MIQSRIFQTQRWLNIPAGLLLAKNVGNVIGAESAGGMSFRKCSGDGIRAVVANDSEQFAHLTGQGSVRGCKDLLVPVINGDRRGIRLHWS